MLLSAASVLVVAQSSSEIPEELMNNPVRYDLDYSIFLEKIFNTSLRSEADEIFLTAVAGVNIYLLF